ncbi:MAG TPA: tyrosine recombinase, partial [Bacteroidales bacterium]|nr:tyrosine recombinase [Bacteroidales bacterium]
FASFLEAEGREISPAEADAGLLGSYLGALRSLGMEASTQARMLSGLRAFFRYLILEGIIQQNPADLVDGPRLGRRLPSYMTQDEIGRMLDIFDLSTAEGQRNRAMVELMYGCGLRVSEACGLRISDLFFSEGFIRVRGKGNKERLVPVGRSAVRQVSLYLEGTRPSYPQQRSASDLLFLNRSGKGISRVSVFKMVKAAAADCGLPSTLGPHTLRHSFATHLVEGGADLRAVQAMLGHASITTTEIYTHLDRTYLRDEILSHHPLERRRRKLIQE